MRRRVETSDEVTGRTVQFKSQPVVVWLLIGFMVGALVILALGRLP